MPDAPNVQPASASDIYFARLVSDFPFFVEELMKATAVDPIGKHDAIDREMFAFVDDRPSKGGSRQRVVLAPRGRGKTLWITCAYTCYRLLGNPMARVMIVSKTATHAQKALKQIRDWLGEANDPTKGVWFLRELAPTGERRNRDNTNAFDVANLEMGVHPSVSAYGVENQITGTRADVLIPDDIETPENTKTTEARDRLISQSNEFGRIASYGEKEIVGVGTYHADASVYIHFKKKLDYDVRSFPCVTPQPDHEVIGLSRTIIEGMRRGVLKPGDLTMPGRFDREYLASEMAKGATEFARQYSLVANVRDVMRYPLRLSDLIVVDQVHRDSAPIEIKWGERTGGGVQTTIDDIEFPGGLATVENRLRRPFWMSDHHTKYDRTVMWVDPSGRGKDETGYAIVGHCQGMLWAKAVGGLPGGSGNVEQNQLIELAYQHGAREMFIEDDGQALTESLAGKAKRSKIDRGDERCPEGWSLRVEAVPRSKSQKELKIIEILSPIMMSHRLVVGRDSVEPAIDGRGSDYELQYQIASLTEERGALAHDDRVESLAMACGLFKEMLVLDPEAAEEQYKKRMQDAEIEQWVRASLGHSGRRKPNWLGYSRN